MPRTRAESRSSHATPGCLSSAETEEFCPRPTDGYRPYDGYTWVAAKEKKVKLIVDLSLSPKQPRGVWWCVVWCGRGWLLTVCGLAQALFDAAWVRKSRFGERGWLLLAGSLFFLHSGSGVANKASVVSLDSAHLIPVQGVSVPSTLPRESTAGEAVHGFLDKGFFSLSLA